MSKLYVDEIYSKTTGGNITANNNIIQPNLIGFHARGTDIGNGYNTLTAYGGQGTAVKFGNSANTSGSGQTGGIGVMDWNSGHYSTSTGEFTTPVAGVYQVNLSMGIFVCDQNESAYPQLLKNGNGVIYSYWHNNASATVNLPLGFSLSLKLAVGDVVKVTLSGSGNMQFYGGRLENTFSMHLIG